MKSARVSKKPPTPILLSKDLTSLLEISKAMISQPSLDKLLDFILAKVTEVINAERSSLFFYNSQTRKLESKIAQKANIRITLSLGEGIAGYTAKHRKVVICPDTYNDRRFLKFFDQQTGYKTRNILSAPMLTSENKLIGVIEVLNKIKGRFTSYDIKLIEAFASQSTIAIQNATLFKENLERKEEIEKLNAQLTERLETIEKELTVRYHYGNIIGQSPKMQQIYKLLDRAKETSFPILIQGESGTGKELIARAIHFNGPRARQKFFSQNCAAIPETLLEAELFGYLKGTFTGADQARKGLFALADGGTLFLDEISNMSLEMQKKILRVLEAGEIRPLGAKDITKVDVRIITASNRNLMDLVKEKKFRDDLFYRLNVIPINLPLLRERKEDILLLVGYFLTKLAEETKTPKKTITKDVMKIFIQYDWPGNVRELENELKKMVTLAGAKIEVSDISPHIYKATLTSNKISAGVLSASALAPSQADEVGSISQAKKDVEREMIIQALEKHNWHITRTAASLGTSRSRLSAKIKKLEIRKPSPKADQLLAEE